ncbi:MAG: DnaJ domain-containing protein [Bdellovibrionota bacterium]
MSAFFLHFSSLKFTVVFYAAFFFLHSLANATSKRDYYDVLGVPRDAGKSEIRAAYRSLSKKYHPDRNPDPAAEERFKEIAEAHRILSDDEFRKQYDRVSAYGGAPGLSSRKSSAFTGTLEEFEEFFARQKKKHEQREKDRQAARGELFHFISLDEEKRRQYLERWLLKTWNGRYLVDYEPLLKEWAKFSDHSAEAFRALLLVHEGAAYIDRGMEDRGVRDAALAGLARNGFRAQYLGEFEPVFEASLLQRRSKAGSSEIAITRAEAIVGFFSAMTYIDAATFKKWFPLVMQKIHDSHVDAWKALRENLEHLNARFPNYLYRILLCYRRAANDWVRSETLWIQGIWISMFKVIPGLVKIAELRPDFKHHVLNTLYGTQPILHGQMGGALVSASISSEAAREAVVSFLKSKTIKPKQLDVLLDKLLFQVGLHQETTSMSKRIEIAKNLRQIAEEIKGDVNQFRDDQSRRLGRKFLREVRKLPYETEPEKPSTALVCTKLLR